MKIKITLPKCGIFIGSAIYFDRGDYVFQNAGKHYTSWVSEDHAPEWYIRKTIEDNQGNTVMFWDGKVSKVCMRAMAELLDLEGIGVKVPEPDWNDKKFLKPEDWDAIEKYEGRYGAGFLKLVKKAAENGLYSLSIYTDALPEYARQIAIMENSFIGYNIGEIFSFDIESDETAQLRESAMVIEDSQNLQNIADNFKRKVSTHIEKKRKNGWKIFLETSASFHLDYEIIAGQGIIPYIESFAFNNLNFGAALSRGLQKQFDLPFWGSQMAHEHYSFLPYSSKCKFKMLDGGFYSGYMNGAKLITLESGNWWQQSDHVTDTPMHKVPKIDLGSIYKNDPAQYAHLVGDARKHYKNLNYNSPICRKYRKSVSAFYDFVKKNGTPEGLPEITLAAVKGNLDLCSQRFNPNYAVAGAYKIAERNPMWYESAPERGWEIFRNIFYPLGNGLGEYQNKFFSGTPYGMTDIVSFATDVSAEYLLESYKALLFTGWNTSSLKQYETLKKYVKSGGTLFISIPHLSMNNNRNYASYSANELVNGGDFSELCGVKVKGRGRQIYWMMGVENNTLSLPKYQYYGIFATHMGDIEITGNPETVAVHEETYNPVLLINRYGKGKVYFLNSWEYPGALYMNEGPGVKNDSLSIIGEIYKSIALENRGTAFITDEGQSPGRNCEYISYSYFPSNGKVYILNSDFCKGHEFFLHLNGKSQKIKLKPAEFRVIQG